METVPQRRGVLTPRVQEKAKELLGYEITQIELRFMPYIQYVMVNNQRLDPPKVSDKEWDVWRQWKAKGFVEGGASGAEITKAFWDAICELIFLAYVDIDL